MKRQHRFLQTTGKHSQINIISGDTHPQASTPRFRLALPGPETELVERFLSRKRIRIPRDVSLSAFFQPKLESGIPDIVFVLWDRAATKTWDSKRPQLSKKDVKLLHYIYQSGPVTDVHLTQRFSQSVDTNLTRLFEAEYLQSSKDIIFTRPLSRIFAIKRIIAVEAKMKHSGTVLSQAVMNTWFASDSFILVPRVSKTSELYSSARALGITLLDEHTRDIPVPLTRSRRLPRSYASWQFNEWVWRNSSL